MSLGGPAIATSIALTVLAIAGFAILVSAMTANMPTGAPNGRHRKSAAQIYGDPDESADQSPGGAAQIGPASPLSQWYTSPGAIIPVSSLAAARALMAHHAMSPQAMLGAQGHTATQMAQMMQAQMIKAQAQAMMAGIGTLTTVGGASPPHPKTVLKSESIRAGEIIAWRAWMIVGDNLRSATASAVWSAIEPMQGDAAAGFGIHAYKSPHGPMMDGYADTGQHGAWVIGEVALWGDVIEHERGYRAEYGRVHSLVTWSRAVPQYARDAISEKYLTTPPSRTMIDDPLPHSPLS